MNLKVDFSRFSTIREDLLAHLLTIQSEEACASESGRVESELGGLRATDGADSSIDGNGISDPPGS